MINRHGRSARLNRRRSSGKSGLLEMLESRLLMSSTLNDLADTYARGGTYAASNFGTSNVMWVKNDSSDSYDRKSYIKFDLSSISGTISSAKLTLTPVNFGTNVAATTIRVQLLPDGSDGWSETGLTWNNQPAGSGLAVTFSGSSVKSNQPLTIDVTALINQSINTNKTAGFVMEVTSAADSQGYVQFATRENATSSYRPTLAVTTSTPTGNFLNLQNATLANLVQNLDADGSINRSDMIQIIRSVAQTDGVVDGTELTDLKTVISDAGILKMPGYVQTLSSDVVNGNAANAQYLGASLGNLLAGSTFAQLDKLVNKWFYGTDHPAAGTNTYRSVSGSLFVNGATYTDEHQGQLGDCYYIASLGSIAKSNPTAIQNMFIDNGDNTWTVRFYYNGVADYVTVDRMLPTNSSSKLVYSNMGALSTNSGNELWMALAEKAYAQWNETGKEGRDGTNRYSAIEGGWMANVDKQVLGKNASGYSLAGSNLSALINGITSNKAVTIGTTSAGGDGLYGSHAYSVVGYDSATAKFQLYNPWGSNQPGMLTYAQLQADTSGFVIADTSGSIAPTGLAATPVKSPFSSVAVKAEGMRVIDLISAL